MEDRIRLRLLTPDGVGWEGKVSAVTLPAAEGSLGVLGGHAPMLFALNSGLVKCRSAAGELRFEISEGVAGVENDVVTLLLSSLRQL